MIEIEYFVRSFLAIYFSMVGIYYATRSYAMSEREGHSFIAYGKRLSKPWWHRHTFNLFRASILGVCVTRLFFDIDTWLGIIDLLYHPVIMLAGVTCLLFSYGITSYVAGYMHKDWFSGIAPDDCDQQLITGGPYAVCRNPLFAGILLGQIGFFLALPSLFSLGCLVVGAMVICGQSRVEEVALSHRYGEHYLTYRKTVPRWFRLKRSATADG